MRTPETFGDWAALLGFPPEWPIEFTIQLMREATPGDIVGFYERVLAIKALPPVRFAAFVSSTLARKS